MASLDGHPPEVADPEWQAFEMPSDQAAEQAVLGAAMLSPDALKELLGMVDGRDFYEPRHEVIWLAIVRVAELGRPVDAVTVARQLGRELAKVGGPAYLHTLMESVPTAANGTYYAQILEEKTYARLLVSTGTRLAQMGRTEIEPELKSAARAEIQRVLDHERRGWDEPVPLTAVRDVPPFPVGALPGWLRAKVEATAHETQTPPDLAATVALGALAAAAGGRAKVAVRPEVSWFEPVNIYCVSALAPGSRKSPVYAAMTRPILELEAELTEKIKPLIIERLVDRKVADDYAAQMRDKAVKAKAHERELARELAREAAAAAEEIVIPPYPRLFLDDVTAETATSILAEQGGRIAVLSAESEIFNEIAGRYSNSQNMNIFLKGHAGDAVRVDRKARAEAVNDPALTICVCTQPSALAALAAVPGASGRGLLARFLYSIPEVNFGARDTRPTPAARGAHIAYAANLTALLRGMRELEAPVILEVSPEAARILDAAAEDFEASMADGARLAHLRDWGAKAVGAMMRIAGLLHLAECQPQGFNTPIGPATVISAHEIIEYYTAHSLAAFELMSTDETTVRARALLRWIESNGASQFDAREAYRGLSRTRFPSMSDLEAPLARLIQHGYIRPRPQAPTSSRGGRPPSPKYLVHPDYVQR
jgi:replicative DNA helicase